MNNFIVMNYIMISRDIAIPRSIIIMKLLQMYKNINKNYFGKAIWPNYKNNIDIKIW